jgi:hypothetical protein
MKTQASEAMWQAMLRIQYKKEERYFCLPSQSSRGRSHVIRIATRVSFYMSFWTLKRSFSFINIPNLHPFALVCARLTNTSGANTGWRAKSFLYIARRPWLYYSEDQSLATHTEGKVTNYPLSGSLTECFPIQIYCGVRGNLWLLWTVWLRLPPRVKEWMVCCFRYLFWTGMAILGLPTWANNLPYDAGCIVQTVINIALIQYFSLLLLSFYTNVHTFILYL